MPAPLPSAAGVGRFLAELKRRKVYRTTAGYAAGAFIVWQAADIAFPAFGLPATAMQPVVIFAIAGFPVAIVLAWLFEVTPQREAAPVASTAAPVSPEPVNQATPSTRLSGIGRGMRIAVLSLVVLGCGGIAYTVIPRTTLELPDGNRLLIADVENHTGDTIFDHALLDALRVGLAQSQHVNVVSYAQARAGMLAMRRDSISTMDESTAIELALRESIAAVLVLSIQKVGSRYTLSTRVVDPATRATLVSRSAQIEGEHDVLSGLDELARQLRSDLGESLASMVRMRVPLDRATTSSLDALRAWTEGNRNYSAGLNDEARLMWERAVELDSTFALAHADLGQFNYWHRNDPLAGERHFEAALRHSDRTTERERLMIRAKSAEWRGDRETAASAYRTVTGLYPKDVHAWGNLGYQFLRLDRQPEAVAAYQKVVELDSASANAWVNLATLHSALTEYAAADEYYRRAFELAPAYRTVPNLNHEYGLNLIGLGQIEEAEGVYTLMLDQSPSQRAQGLRSIAMLRFLAGRFTDAEQELRQAVVVSGSIQARTSELRNRGLLVESLMRRGRSADGELTHAADLAGTDFIASFWVHHIGVWLARAGRVEGARELLDTARARLDSDPLSKVAVMRLEAEIALAEGDTASAAERFEAALALDPDWIVALSGLAQLRYAEGNLEQAQRHLLEIVKSREHSPGDENLADWVLARYRLARIHDERGDLDAARERYNEFLALWSGGDRDVPEIASARERLGILGRRPRVGVR